MPMRLVVADTGPLNYLVLIDAIDVLPRLFEQILVPAAVYDELASVTRIEQSEIRDVLSAWSTPSGRSALRWNGAADPGFR